MNEDRNKEFNELVAGFIDGTLDPLGTARLLEMCREDEELKERFEWQVDTHRLLDLALEDESGIFFDAEVMERIRHEGAEDFVEPVIGKVLRISRRRKWTRWMASAAVAAMVVMGAAWWISAQGIQATLHRGDAAKWVGDQPSSDLRSGSRLRLESGLAEIHFKNGTQLILEGPADFEIRSRGKARLQRGKIVARVPHRAIGFTLESPAGKLIDLGTSFGMRVADNGETETQVFEGKVRVDPIGGSSKTIVHQNETFAVGSKGAVKSAGASDSGFVTSMPPQAGSDIPFVHWPMNEGQGLQVGALLSSGRIDPVPGRLQTFNDNEGLPQWIEGPFGNALSFNGYGHALETYHQGLQNDAARTIAFWVKVPVDFDPAQGFGIISWGKLGEWGTAWQISMNPYGVDGNYGRLRVGTGKSGVVGERDLRDGKWHHCAVVLYKDPVRPDRFPVLLYVDGEMESASSKAVYGVRTDVGEDARPIWIGRSLGHGREKKPPQGTGFFRGDLDEVYVFEGALNRMQIEELMQRNKAPGQ